MVDVCFTEPPETFVTSKDVSNLIASGENDHNSGAQ